MNKKISNWVSPYNSDSIWNKPIGADAKTVKAGLIPAPAFHFEFEDFISAEGDDPVYTVRVQGEDTVLHMPDNGLHTCEYTCVLQPDGERVIQMRNAKIENSVAVCDEIYTDSLSGDGMGGVHLGSAMSALGGTIRKGELINDEPIRHALKMRISSNRFLYCDGDSVLGFRHPASRADACAQNSIKEKSRYSGTVKDVVQGTLLTLPKNLTPEILNLRSRIGRKLFYAIRDYGAYIVDSQAVHSIGFFCEYAVKQEMLNTVKMRTEGWLMDSILPEERNYVHDLNHIAERMVAVTLNSDA